LVNATEGNNAGIIAPLIKAAQDKGFTFRQTAQDGVQFSPENYKNQPFLNQQRPGGFTLAGGNRADLLVQAPPTAVGVVSFNNNSKGTPTLFFVNVTGEAVTPPQGPFPTAWAEMPKFLLDLPKPGPKDLPNPGSPVKFQWEQGRTDSGLNDDLLPPHYMINGKQFGETGAVVDQCMPLSGLQDWVLENDTTVAHPFHIHINPFQVVEIDTPVVPNPNNPPSCDNPVTYSVYKPADNFVWQDVIALPLAQISADGTQIWPGKITIRQTYPDFTGTFVLHCHILAHEDRGMMELVRIVPAAEYTNSCQGNVPQHH